MSILDSAGGVLLVHAHPDDETISTGALIGELVAGGRRVWLLTATRGERGEVVPGPLSGLEGTPELAAVRERELRCAMSVLGIDENFRLGDPPALAPGATPRRYRDSGMRWIRPGLAGPAEDIDDDALTAAPVETVIADVAALIHHLNPTLVVSYSHDGSYGHPDHVRMHEATLAACGSSSTPFAEIVSAPADDVEWLDLGAHAESLIAALRCHASQLTVDGADIVHSGGQREPIVASLGLRLRRP